MTSLSTERIKIYYQLYEEEFKSRDALSASLAPYLSTLTLLIGGAVFLAAHAPRETSATCLRVAFSTVLILGLLSLIAGTGYCLSTLWTRLYSRTPSLGKIEEWRSETAALGVKSAATIEEELLSALSVEIAMAADENRATNRERGDMAYRAKISVATALVFLAIATLISWSTGALVREDTPANQGRLEIYMSQDSKDPEPTPSTNENTKSIPFPKRERLKEGSERPKGDVKKGIITGNE